MAVAALSVFAAAVGGCGASSSSTAARSTSDRTIHVTVAPTTTTTLTPITPLDDAEGACRSFASFAEFIKNVGQDGIDASGEIGGMIQQAHEAATGSAATPGAAKLLTDLQALQAQAESSTWISTPAETTTPPFVTIATDCKAFPTR